MLLDPYRDIQAKTGPKRFWTTREDRILREHYTEHGAEHCARLLPGRTIGAVHQYARKIGLKGKQFVNLEFRQRWTTGEQIDAVIRRAYQSEPKPNLIAKTAQTVGRPRWWVSKRASQLGIVAPRFKEPAWTQAEIALAEAHAHKHPQTIARILKKNGFKRSPTAITVSDMWWIHRKQIRRFVVENVAAIDFRKVDKFWLVDLLVGFAE